MTVIAVLSPLGRIPEKVRKCLSAPKMELDPWYVLVRSRIDAAGWRFDAVEVIPGAEVMRDFTETLFEVESRVRPRR